MVHCKERCLVKYSVHVIPVPYLLRYLFGSALLMLFIAALHIIFNSIIIIYIYSLKTVVIWSTIGV